MLPITRITLKASMTPSASERRRTGTGSSMLGSAACILGSYPQVSPCVATCTWARERSRMLVRGLNIGGRGSSRMVIGLGSARCSLTVTLRANYLRFGLAMSRATAGNVNTRPEPSIRPSRKSSDGCPSAVRKAFNLAITKSENQLIKVGMGQGLERKRVVPIACKKTVFGPSRGRGLRYQEQPKGGRVFQKTLWLARPQRHGIICNHQPVRFDDAKDVHCLRPQGPREN